MNFCHHLFGSRNWKLKINNQELLILSVLVNDYNVSIHHPPVTTVTPQRLQKALLNQFWLILCRVSRGVADLTGAVPQISAAEPWWSQRTANILAVFHALTHSGIIWQLYQIRYYSLWPFTARLVTGTKQLHTHGKPARALSVDAGKLWSRCDSSCARTVIRKTLHGTSAAQVKEVKGKVVKMGRRVPRAWRINTCP